LKTSTYKGLCLASIVMLICSVPHSSRAYIPYVQPSVVENRPLPGVKEVKRIKKVKKKTLVAVKKVKGYGTGYFGPRREDYRSKWKYLAATRMNGEGKLTKSGTTPRVGTIAADTRFYPLGTTIFIPEINLMATVEDVGSAVKGPKHVDIFCGHGKKAEKIAMTWGPGTPITLVVMKEKMI